MSTWRLDADRVLVYSPADGACDVLSDTDAALLSAGSDFRPLADHARCYTRTCGGDVGVWLERLEALTERGYLKPVDAFISDGGQTDAGDTPSIAWLAIPTRDREDAIVTCVRSYAAHAAEHGHGIRVFVADGGTAAACGTRLRELGRAIDVPIVYAGHEAKVRYARALARYGGFPLGTLQFGLLGHGWPGEAIGANRNAILLGTCGDLLLSVDDDTRCSPHLGPLGTSPGLALCSDADVSDMWCYASGGAACAAALPAEIDVLGQHARLLGQTPSAVASRMPRERIVFDGTCDHLLASLLSRRGRVVATLNGVTGDSGLYSGDWVALHGSPATRRRWLDSGHDSLHTTRAFRNVIRQPSQTSICHGGHFMTFAAGLDNRYLLPPFLPVYRSEDRFFSALIGWCSDDLFYAHLPWTLLHLPEGCRSNATRTWTTRRVSDLLLAILDSLASAARPESPESRLRWLGSAFEAWGTAPLPEFRQFLIAAIQTAVTLAVERHERALRSADDATGRWAPERAQLHGALAALHDPDFYIPVEWRGRWTGDDGWSRLQSLITDMGRLMKLWPDIVCSASALAARGCHLGDQVS